MILITGASSGLGAELARLYDEDDETLVLTGRSREKLTAIASTLKGKVTTCATDLSEYKEVVSLFDLIDQPNTIIHCAGSGYFGPLEEQEPNEIANLIANNLTSTIYLLQESVKRFKNQHVRMVIIMSTAANQAKANESTYCAVKWGVKGLVESLKLELKELPMTLVSVYPGGIATEFWQTSGHAMDTSAFMTPIEAATMIKKSILTAEHGYVSDITVNRY